MAKINMPMRFPGTPEQALENRQTHNWHDVCGDGEYRCWECDCKLWHITAEWPCGFAVPRVTEEEGDLEEWFARWRAYAQVNG